MDKVKAKGLKSGKVVYFVHALGEHSFIQKHIVQTPVRTSKLTGYHYVNTLSACTDGILRPSRFFISDAGIDIKDRSQHYNKHRSFYKYKAATRYMKMCIELNIKQETPNHFDSWDY